MKNNLLQNFLPILFSFLFLLVPLTSSAQLIEPESGLGGNFSAPCTSNDPENDCVTTQQQVTGGGSGQQVTGGGTGQQVTGGGSGGSGQLQNPLKINTIQELLLLILRVVIIFLTPIIIFFLIYAGFLFVTASGNETQLEKAKTALLWTIIGGVIVLGAEVLLRVIQNTVAQIQA